MLGDIFKIAIMCVALGSASIPLSFNVNESPWVVWLGNALGSLFSAAVVIYIGDRIASEAFKDRLRQRRVGRKVVKAFDAAPDSKAAGKVQHTIHNHGLKAFSLFCPIFPGVLISTATVYLLDLDKKVYKRWMFTGVFFVSGLYVLGYWWFFVK